MWHRDGQADVTRSLTGAEKGGTEAPFWNALNCGTCPRKLVFKVNWPHMEEPSYTRSRSWAAAQMPANRGQLPTLDPKPKDNAALGRCAMALPSADHQLG
jgi:hypothetical protein